MASAHRNNGGRDHMDDNPPYPSWVRTGSEGIPHQNGAAFVESREAATARKDVGLVLGNDQHMKEAWQQTILAAKGTGKVLLRGETGTGKEVICKAIHHLRGQERPFVDINCATLDSSLAASTLFGHVKGSFTGAQSNHKGIFEQGNGGTVFLDEVSEMSPALQSMLLRVLETDDVRPLGGEKTIKLENVKIIAASNKPLEKLIKEGRFQQDLFYRLATHQIILPALRNRTREHRIELIGHLLHSKKPNALMAEEALETLLSLPMYGNVRELQHILERALDALHEGEILIMPHHLPVNAMRRQPLPGNNPLEEVLQFSVSDGGGVLEAVIHMAHAHGNVQDIADAVRLRLIEISLERHGGNINAVAAETGVSRATLYRLLGHKDHEQPAHA